MEFSNELISVFALYVLVVAILFTISQGITVYLFFKALKDKKIGELDLTINLSKITYPAIAYIITYCLYYIFY